MKLSERAKNETKNLISLLSAAADEIRRHEETAKVLLYENNDKPGYHARLRQKSIVLCTLLEALKLYGNLPLHIKAMAQEKIGSFSFEAERALRLDSVFYMAVLLYPEDHQEGSPNELDNLINSLINCL